VDSPPRHDNRNRITPHGTAGARKPPQSKCQGADPEKAREPGTAAGLGQPEDHRGP
jgi:hypothetical protein